MTEFEWRVIEPLLPNKPRGVPRVDDRRVLNGIFWILRSGSPWRDLPERYGPHTTCYNRFRRWTKAGVWDRIMDAITDAYGGDVRMIMILVGNRLPLICPNTLRASAPGMKSKKLYALVKAERRLVSSTNLAASC